MKRKLKPYELKVIPGYYDSDGKYYQNRNDLPFDAPRNQWTAKIGSIGDAIEKAINCGEYTVKEIAYLASTKTNKVRSHIIFPKDKNFDVINENGIIKFK